MTTLSCATEIRSIEWYEGNRRFRGPTGESLSSPLFYLLHVFWLGQSICVPSRCQCMWIQHLSCIHIVSIIRGTPRSYDPYENHKRIGLFFRNAMDTYIYPALVRNVIVGMCAVQISVELPPDPHIYMYSHLLPQDICCQDKVSMLLVHSHSCLLTTSFNTQTICWMNLPHMLYSTAYTKGFDILMHVLPFTVYSRS